MNYETRYNKDWMPFAHPRGFIRLILLVDFDPIKVFGEPGAMDEYDSYAAGVYDLFQAGADAAAIAVYLGDLQSELMAKTVEPERLIPLAEKIWRTCHRAFAPGEDSA